MTLNLQIPNRKLTVWDRILKALGKERLPVMPSVAIGKAYQELGACAYLAATVEWEGFWHCLFRRNQQEG